MAGTHGDAAASAAGREVSAVAYDSRTVGHGAVFVAPPDRHLLLDGGAIRVYSNAPGSFNFVRIVSGLKLASRKAARSSAG